MYRSILIAVDGSDNSMRAAREAVKLASLLHDCQIEVVFVVDFSKTKNEVLHSHSKAELEVSRRKKLLPIEEVIKESRLAYSVTILHGDPAATLIDYANKGGVDLVVIGSRGLNSLQTMVLGSVSNKVVKKVTSPVLIVK